MVGDGRVLIATLEAGIGDLLHRGDAVTPLGVHLQVAAILSNSGASE